MIKKTSAGVLIFYLKNNNPIFLLLEYSNYWGFVKGLIEDNETETDTAKREAKEEANLSDITMISGFRHIINYFFKWDGDIVSKQVIFLLGKVNKEQAEKVKISFEHQDFKWLNFDEAIKIVKHNNEKELLIKADTFIKEYLKQRRLE